MSSPTSPLIGIDLGTTNSLCAIFQDGKSRLIPNAAGSELTPSIVGVLESGEIVVGEAAKQLALTQPDRTIATFKRWMGETRKVQAGGKEFTAPELSAIVLSALKADAEAYLGVEVSDVVITVPAYFNEHQRRATRRAGELAGLRVKRVLNEPTAAALCYGHGSGEQDALLLVFDLGGGTFDVTIMEIFEGTLEILSTAGESRLGGEDFTERLLGWALKKMDRQLEQAEMTEPLLVARLASEAEKAKLAFTQKDRVTLRLPDHEGNVAPNATVLEIGAAEFEEHCSLLLERLKRPLERALRDAGKTKGQVDQILLVGGATRMPIIRRLVGDVFERPPRTDVDPDRVVALGAAIQAALMQDDKGVEDLVLTDVCPFTLGINISKEFGSRHVDGYYMPILHRNTTIPVSTEEYVCTLHENQTQVLIGVYQGEGRRVEDNIKLGELQVTGIPPGPAGQNIAVRFTYDLNGLLEVEAFLPKTGAKFQTLLQGGSDSLSEEELQAAVKRMQELKFYPREDLANQELLRFGEGVVRELDRYSRESLEAALDDFERAMESGDREYFADAKKLLRITLSGAGFPPPKEGSPSQDENKDGEENA